jgi:putative ABC transport system substrate-binding protein
MTAPSVPLTRRALLAGGLGALCPAPVAAAPPPGKIHRIGVIGSSLAAGAGSGPRPSSPPMAALLRGLRELGYVYGEHFVTEVRSAEGHIERIPTIAAELARLKVDMIVAGGPTLPGLKQANLTIPIIMGAASDPVRLGLVESLARPGGTFTGFSMQATDLDKKRVELLAEVVPGSAPIAFLGDPNTDRPWTETRRAAAVLKRTVLRLTVRSAGEIEGAFRAAVNARAGGLLVMGVALLDREAKQVVQLAARHRLPAMYIFRLYYMEQGGLMSYGVDVVDIWRRLATFVDRILNGARAADLPVEQPEKLELIINLKTAQAIGLTIPPSVLARADELIR